ncbi:hypothetical protein BGX33_000322 [Mortierella sp. NVP41]|nr:hypothetical protein BGX33_000322 [Mortierella sp. NVP41]
MTEDRLSLHRLSPPEDMNEHSSSNNNRPFHDNLWLHRRHPATAEGSSSDRSRVSTVESGSHVPPPLQRTHHTASMGQDHPFDPEMSTSSNSYTGNNNTPSSSSSSLLKSPSKKWTSTESIFQRKVLSARGTPKGPLPMNVQINLLSSVLRHDPFNCPIRRTTQVWEIISREQGVRARTCARRYDNIIQASIAGRERPIGTEEQIAIKKKLLDQLFVMMNQPQALVRMQKKKRYRSEEADRQLLQETIRLNPFAQKMGQVAKAWEDVRDALKMQVHARQCIRRVNRMIKPYQLRERMYHGNIPDEMKEENDELIKQVIQMMQASGQGGPLEEDDEEDAEDDSASDSDDQEDSNQGRSRRRSDSNGSSKAQGNGGKDNNEIGEEETSTSRRIKSSTAIDVSVSPRSPALSIVQSPQTMATTPAASEPPSLASSEPTTPAQKSNGRPRQSSQSSVGNFGHTSNKRSLVDRTDDEMVAVATPSPRHPFESEFKPQRLWGSHPYSKERSSRMPHGTHLQRVWSPPSVARGQNDPHRPAKYTRSSSSDLLRDSTKDQQDRSMALQSSFHSPTAGGSDSGHYDHQRQHQHQHQHSGHMQARTEAVMDGQVAISSAQQKQQQPVAQLYRAILGEFRAVQRYLGQMEDQRQQDKERQAEMRYLMDKLQYQIHQQQQSIQDLQLQLNQQQQPQSQQQQQQQQPSRTSPPHQQQQQDHRRSPQHYEQHRASQDYSSHSFITSLSSGVDHPPKSLEDQE